MTTALDNSIIRPILAMASGGSNPERIPELKASRDYEMRKGRPPRVGGFYAAPPQMSLDTKTVGGGRATVPTLVPGDLITQLRPQPRLAQLGSPVVNLESTTAFPDEATGPTCYYLGENSGVDVTEGSMVFGSRTLAACDCEHAHIQSQLSPTVRLETGC